MSAKTTTGTPALPGSAEERASAQEAAPTSRGPVAVIFESVGPYHAARMRALAEAVGKDACVAVEVASSSKKYPWNVVHTQSFRRLTLFADAEYEDLTARRISQATMDALGRLAPSIVAVNGWTAPEARAAVIWCGLHGRNAVLMAESQERDWVRNPVAEWVKRQRVVDLDAALVGGESHANYVAKLGMPRDAIARGYDVVDNEHFSRGADAARADARRLREKLGLPPSFVLASARFVPKKNLDGLLRGFARYRNIRGGGLDLVVLGDGPLRKHLLTLRAKLALERYVAMPGFKQYDELPAYYGLAEGFIIPSSREQWGLVVNEAMAAGLPVLVSSACGSSELVEDGRNGFVLDPESVDEIATALRGLERADRGAMGKESRRIIAGHAPSAFARGLLDAIRLAQRRELKRAPGRISRAARVLWDVRVEKRGAPGAPTLAVIVERIGPYHAARLGALARSLGEGKLLVLEMASHSSEYAWEAVALDGVRRRTLLTDCDYRSTTPRRRWLAVMKALEDECPEAVAVNGWAAAEARGAAYWCQRNDRTTIVMSASQERDLKRTPSREWVKSLLVKGYDSALVGGAAQAEYLTKLGLDRDRIFQGYDVVDNDYFAERARWARSSESTKRQIGVEGPFFLCVARFLPKKNLARLLEAYARYRREKGEDAWSLVLVGDGPLRAELEKQAASIGGVYLRSFLTYEELPAYYGLAQAFILPSTTEQWGLVVNEAMASGLPVIVSQQCGCAQDLVQAGRNGYHIDPCDTSSLVSAMARLHHDDLRAMGERSREIVADWGLDRFTNGMRQALEAGIAHRRRRTGTSASIWYSWKWS